MNVRDRPGSRPMGVARLIALVAAAVLVSGCELINSALQGTGAIATSIPAEPAPSGATLGGWTTFTLSDPALDFEIPSSWQQTSAADTEDQIKAELSGLSAAEATALNYEIQLIEQGQAREFFQGPSTDTNATDSIEIDVLTNGDSLAAAVSREDRTDDAMIGAPTTRRETPVTLPIGSSVLEISTITPPAGASGEVPSMNVGYYIRVDGSTIELLGSATADDAAFPALMAHVAESLSQP